MTRRKRFWIVAVSVVLAFFHGRTALAFGPLAHRIAGLLAEPELCAAARTQVAVLGGESLAELGVWADTIRSEPEWRRSAPWHYMNVDAAAANDVAAALAAIRAYRHPPEGDVLYAIERFRADLGNRALSRRARSQALRFLAHFIVDLHQPLHVGRAADRGGNEVEVRHGPETVNLHRFWDTDVLALRGLSAERYASRLRPALAAVPASRLREGADVWAAESLALRATVYAFPRQPAAANVRMPVVLDDDYVASAQVTTEHRLVLASARLAAALNGLWCTSESR